MFTNWIYGHMKAIIAGLGSMAILYFTLRGPDGGLTSGSWQAMIISGLSLAGVTFAVPNTGSLAGTKTVMVAPVAAPMNTTMPPTVIVTSSSPASSGSVSQVVSPPSVS